MLTGKLFWILSSYTYLLFRNIKNHNLEGKEGRGAGGSHQFDGRNPDRLWDSRIEQGAPTPAKPQGDEDGQGGGPGTLQIP